jgi:cell division protein FtsB
MTMKLKRTNATQLSLAHFVAIAIVAVSVFLLVDFGSKAVGLLQATQNENRWEEEVAKARATKEALQERLEYVRSDTYVEEIARTRLKWSRLGETVVIVVSPPSTLPVAEGVDLPFRGEASTPQSSWMDWWFLFFDDSPPTIF